MPGILLHLLVFGAVFAQDAIQTVPLPESQAALPRMAPQAPPDGTPGSPLSTSGSTVRAPLFPQGLPLEDPEADAIRSLNAASSLATTVAADRRSAANIDYEARLAARAAAEEGARQEYRSALDAAAAAREAALANWRAQVAACLAGDKTQCAQDQ